MVISSKSGGNPNMVISSKSEGTLNFRENPCLVDMTKNPTENSNMAKSEGKPSPAHLEEKPKEHPATNFPAKSQDARLRENGIGLIVNPPPMTTRKIYPTLKEIDDPTPNTAQHNFSEHTNYSASCSAYLGSHYVPSTTHEKNGAVTTHPANWIPVHTNAQFRQYLMAAPEPTAPVVPVSPTIVTQQKSETDSNISNKPEQPKKSWWSFF